MRSYKLSFYMGEDVRIRRLDDGKVLVSVKCIPSEADYDRNLFLDFGPIEPEKVVGFLTQIHVEIRDYENKADAA